MKRWIASDGARRAGRALLGLCLAPLLWMLWAAALTPLPDALRTGAVSEATSTRLLDRHGLMLREVRAADGTLAQRVRVSDLPEHVVLAVLAAEDARFYRHPGVDPIAVARAAGQAVWHRRIVSGASTITQQLARSLFDRPRSLSGKLSEMALALRIEASLDKQHILEEYLNRVEFGANVRGIDAASRLYFDKPAAKLDLAEAATLAGIPRGPTLYDPRRGVARVTERRNRVLERMRDRGFAPADAVSRALAQPVVLQAHGPEGGAQHFLRAVANGRLAPELAGKSVSKIETTLDAGLQREVETLTRRTVERIAGYDASAAAVIVVDNASGDILAYVGSPDFFDANALGQNDGVLALRQPGSALKPFVYAAGLSRLGLTAASILPDVELHLATPEGDYSPRNYDGRFHGPVRVREALANSLNVPAVYVADSVGPGAVLDVLHRVGFSMLDREPAHYGAALALGDGEVTLAALAEAYSTLARGGLHRPLRAVESARLADGQELALTPVEPTRAIDADVSAVLTDVLSDRHARTSSFGRGSELELPFDVAAKTGTSKGFRDNWTAGYTHEVTVAVWVGNFDGRPMRGSSGVTGAAPLFHDVMLVAMRGREPAPLEATPLVEMEVCALSGKLAGPHCEHRVNERFVPGHVPTERCDMHVEVAVDPANGLRAGPGCSHPELRSFERYPPRFTAWAERAGRPLAPTRFSPACPGSDAVAPGAPSVAYPFAGARFVLDPSLGPDQQAIVLTAHAPDGVSRVRFLVDGHAVATRGAPFAMPWPLTRGAHRVEVETVDGQRSDPAPFYVE